MSENRTGSCAKVEAHSLKRAETGGEDVNPWWLSDRACPGTATSLNHGCLCTLDVSFPRGTTAGRGGREEGWGGSGRYCSIGGQSSKVTLQMCWDEGPRPDRGVNDDVYLCLVCRGRLGEGRPPGAPLPSHARRRTCGAGTRPHLWGGGGVIIEPRWRGCWCRW